MRETYEANNPPTYLNASGSTSAFAHECLIGSPVLIRKDVLVQHLKGAEFPDNNIFESLKLLEPSSVYDYEGNWVKSAIPPLEEASLKNVKRFVDFQFESIASLYSHIVIPLSGGYDSRLNLIAALHFSNTYGNKVMAFHKLVHLEELEIVKELCNCYGVPLLVDRSFTHYSYDSLMYDSKFILFHSGTYRNNILSYSRTMDSYLNWHRSCTFIGMGGEIHKGRRYKLMDEYPGQYSRILGHAVFNDTVDHAKQTWTDPTAVLDYLLYVHFISHGYGKRCFYFTDRYDMRFPFLCNKFIQMVFSLPREHKEGCFLVNWLLDSYGYDFKHPFYSHDSKKFQAISMIDRFKTKIFKHEKPEIDPAGALVPMRLQDDPVIDFVVCSSAMLNWIYCYEMYLYLVCLKKKLSCKFAWA